MKKLILLLAIISIICSSCVEPTVKEQGTELIPAIANKYIGQLNGEISIFRAFDDKIILQKELDTGFDVYNIDMASALLSFEYTVKPQEKLLYSKQLDAERVLQVKQLGNSEENNVLILEGKTTENIARNIAYSGNALVTVDPQGKYVVYCAVEGISGKYVLYLYNLDTAKNLLLTSSVDEELLNDVEWSISWSNNETYLVVSNKLIFNVATGELAGEINAQNICWSPSDRKLAFIKTEKGYGKALCVLNLSNGKIEEVFIANKKEYLPGYIVWNQKETKLCFITAKISSTEASEEIGACSGFYSLNLADKEALRIDTLLKLDEEISEKLVSLCSNASGNIVAFAVASSFGIDLYVYDLISGSFGSFSDIEYLHHESNESYICNAGDNLYFAQGSSLLELDENLNSRVIYTSQGMIQDIYISDSKAALLVIENIRDATVFRRLTDFAKRSM